jgi:hypothetical protein
MKKLIKTLFSASNRVLIYPSFLFGYMDPRVDQLIAAGEPQN